MSGVSDPAVHLLLYLYEHAFMPNKLHAGHCSQAMISTAGLGLLRCDIPELIGTRLQRMVAAYKK
jgi:hypothetical protein